MLRRLRTYRFVAAFLAATLLLAGALPLIQHVCSAEGLTVAVVQQCCCGDAMPTPTPEASVDASEAPPCHGTMADAPATHQAAEASSEACCTGAVGQHALSDVVLEKPASLVVDLAVVVLADADTQAARATTSRLAGMPERPPTPPQRFHILFASFLS